MALINNRQTWQEYQRAYKGIMSNQIDYRQNSIPEEIRRLYEREKPITITDLSHELVKSMLVFYAENIAGSFKIDNDNQSVIELIVQYLRNDESFLKANNAFSFSKGLLLHGPVGSGKTVLFKAIREMLSYLNYFNIWRESIYQSAASGRFRIISANEIVRRYSVDGNLIFLRGEYDRKIAYVELITEPLCIDDFGSEGEAVHFGAKTNVLSEILLERYEKNSLTHISTNLGMNSIKDLYQLRVFDRCREMFNDIALTGNSRRK